MHLLEGLHNYLGKLERREKANHLAVFESTTTRLEGLSSVHCAKFKHSVNYRLYHDFKQLINTVTLRLYIAA